MGLKILKPINGLNLRRCVRTKLAKRNGLSQSSGIIKRNIIVWFGRSGSYFRIIRQKTRILLCGFYAWDVWLGLHYSCSSFRFLFLFRWNYDPCHPKTLTKVSSQGGILCQRTSNVRPPSRMNLRIFPAAEF